MLVLPVQISYVTWRLNSNYDMDVMWDHHMELQLSLMGI